MNGAFARRLHWWIIRAAISLPTPGGPEIRTRLPVGATRFRVARTVLIGDRAAVQLVLVAHLLAQGHILAAHALGLGRAVDQIDQPLGLERLLDEVDRPFPHRGDRSVEIAVAGDHQHRDASNRGA